MKLDILCFAAHPDDIELSCAGTIIKHIKMGYKVGIIDLTQGELGTRGTAETRFLEAKDAMDILGISIRENLNLGDGFFEINQENKLKIVESIRKYQPKLVLANSITDRHPDHGRASQLVSEACFLSGLPKVKTQSENEDQVAWRPETIYHYIQDHYIKPDFIVDITNEIDQKIEAIKAFKTQFWDPNSKEPATPISGQSFLDFIKGRAMEFGRLIKTDYAEGFTTETPIKVNDITKH